MSLRNLIFVAFVEPVTDGQVFPRTDWPLHITLVRFDAACTDSADVAERLAGLADAHAAAALGAGLAVGEDAAFGRNGSVPVSLMEPTPALQNLHGQLVAIVEGLGGRIPTPRHTLSGYRPHISHQGAAGPGGKRLHPGDAVVLDRVALVDMAPDGDHTIRRILRLWSLEPEAG
ncbi:2'-5' RNA ligase family protein [Arthrobacter liuii]|uniref:2'-5' RNA ligase superfamily protein n=1 Tax=Arthrobacter liuii TaxID=1476996 RepID=A0ABQ2AR68_9MICC|nr:2'-5' RNA ligase family protein [Arthrobacter liuii]GGH95785.1 hypothetical protein GCM10007170_22120 [Arthrobacter liuii]